MEEKAGAQIGTRAFLQSLIILFVMMMVAGILTRVLPAGSYARVEQQNHTVIDPNSFKFIPSPGYPIWRWFVAPIEVLWGPNGLTIGIIIVFLLLVGISFAVLDGTGILRMTLNRLVKSYRNQKYILLLIISLFFMLLGAFFGIFEEVVPLVPMMIALSYILGWDALVGLGMSIMATNMGFSAALTNPFTIGVAQKLAGLPLFSGAFLRVFIFIAIYLAFAIFLSRYARKIERNPELSPVFEAEKALRVKYSAPPLDSTENDGRTLRKASLWFLVFLVLIILVLVTSPFIPAISDFSLPIVGLLFFIGGLGAGFLSGEPAKLVLKSVKDGFGGIVPAIPLILMAASVQYIIAQGGVMDTILHSASFTFSQASPFAAALIVYGLALVIEVFIASGSAKAFLLMPIMLPLADLIGVTRQTAVTAYCFGDGFSNLMYPTNPVLLISLGLTVVSYPKWIRWSLKIWLWVILITVIFLGIAVAVHYGPF